MRHNKKRTSEVLLTKSIYMTFNEIQDRILPVFDQFNDSCTAFQKQLDKIKLMSSSESKSLKYVISKMEEVVSTHKTELGHTLKSLTIQYSMYLKNKLKAEEKRKQVEGNRTADLKKVEEPTADSDNVDSDDHSARRVRTFGNETEDFIEEKDKSYMDESLLETDDKESSRISLSSSEWDADDHQPKKQKTKKPSIPLAVDYDDPKLNFQCLVGLERCDNLLNGETTIPVPAKFISDDLDREIVNLCQLSKKKSWITPKARTHRQKEFPAPKKGDDGESSRSDENGSQICDDDSLNSDNDTLEEWSKSEGSEEDEWSPSEEKRPVKNIYSKNKAISKANMSEYEKMIQTNKEKSLAFLKSLNMEEVKQSFCEGVHNLKQKPKRLIVEKAKRAKLESRQARSPLLPCRKSLRIVDKEFNLSEEACERRYRSHSLESRKSLRLVGKDLNLSEEALENRYMDEDKHEKW